MQPSLDLIPSDRGLRSHVVWFGEDIQNFEVAIVALKSASKVLVVGTSLTVYPAASLLNMARFHAEKILVSLQIDKKPFGYNCWNEKATIAVPSIVRRWLEGQYLGRLKY